MKRRVLVSALAGLSAVACVSDPAVSTGTSSSIEIINAPNLDAMDMAAGIAAGHFSAADQVAFSLGQIETLDRSGPTLQSVLSINPEAMAQAKALDEEARNGALRGPLHGVPVLVKDNIETRELPTTAGSLALLENRTGRDAPIIARLRASGAIILGKTNLSEWANFRSTNSMSGWSGVGGQTKNPHSLDRSPCGSSSGSAVAVAAGLVPLAIGTETNGSIMCPSAMNGIVGIKPTVGLLSRTHIVPISPTQDTAGPMARDVKSAALMLAVMAGEDPADPATAKADDHVTDYLAELDGDLSGLRIGVLRFAVGENEEIGAVFADGLADLEAAGATLVDIDAFESGEAFSQSFYILQAEFKTALNSYLADAAPAVTVRSLDDLIAYNEVNAARELALFGQEILLMSQETGGMEEARYKGAYAALRKASRDEGIHHLLKEYDVDVLVAPSRPPAFLIDAVYGDEYPGGTGADYIAAIAGTPNMTVPMGTVRGLPVGMSFMARAWDEATMIRAAYGFEQQSRAIVSPGFAANSFVLEETAGAMRPYAAPGEGGE
ncbi:amidase [Parvularcula marina]|uniref:Amidase n=1 Tax=Parvularcula marina TaxID=2292771 RepID=A0A371RIU6_9PROT|nr:amidase [Parvularcula marina]RFB05364.1 amidase [Parvularcula marina]